MLASSSLVLILLSIYGANGFSIAIMQPSPLAISKGKDLLLTCYPVDVSMFVPLEWWGPDGLLITNTDQSTRRYVMLDPTDPRKVQLHVRDVGPIDAGNYQCRYNPGVDSAGQILTKSIVVQVTEQMNVVDCSNFQYLPYLDNMRMIVCRIDGNPAPTKLWFYAPKTETGAPGKWVLLQSGSKYSYQTNGLQVYNIDFNDAGWYRLQASIESVGQSVIQDIEVTVDTRPSVTGPVVYIEPFNNAATDYDLWMQCLGVTGNPKPTVGWYFNRQFDRILSQQTSPRYYADIETGVLQIKHLTVEDAGTYTCRASNRVGDTDYNHQMTVLIRPHVVRYLNVTAEVNSNQQLVCDVSGSAPITVMFWKTGDPWQPARPGPYVLGTQPDDERISFSLQPSANPNQFTAVLNIARVQPEDTANYSCIAQNAGANMTQNGTLIVMHRPRLDSSLMTGAVGYAGNVTNLTCIVWGNPSPRWRWYRRQAEVEPSANDTFRIFEESYVRYYKTILQIRVRFTDQYWIYDWYFCNASNEYGTVGHGIYFSQAQPAAPPTVTLTELSASGIKFSVTPPVDTGGTWVTGYQITYRAQDEQWRPAIWYPPEETIEIQHLNANQMYFFHVSTLNPVGPGVPAKMDLKTLDHRVPYPCIVVSPTNASSPYAYLVRWAMSGSGGSVVSDYFIKIRRVIIAEPLNNTTDSVVVMNVLSDWVEYRVTAFPLMHEFLIRNLLPDTYYQVQVLAKNAYGFSEPVLNYFKTAPPHPSGRAPLLLLDAPSISPSRSVMCLLAGACILYILIGHRHF